MQQDSHFDLSNHNSHLVWSYLRHFSGFRQTNRAQKLVFDKNKLSVAKNINPYRALQREPQKRVASFKCPLPLKRMPKHSPPQTWMQESIRNLEDLWGPSSVLRRACHKQRKWWVKANCLFSTTSNIAFLRSCTTTRGPLCHCPRSKSNSKGLRNSPLLPLDNHFGRAPVQRPSRCISDAFGLEFPTKECLAPRDIAER